MKPPLLPTVLMGVVGAAAFLSVPLRVLFHACNQHRICSETPDVIAVLGTAQYDGRPSRQLQARLDQAWDVAQKHPAATVVTLGGGLPGDRYTEAGVAKTYLEDKGLEPSRVIAVSQGSDTRGSVEAAGDALQGRVAVVTDPLHALRSEIIVRTAGFDAFSLPTPYCPARFPDLQWWWSLAHECAGLIVIDVFRLAGRGAAVRVEALLRRIEGFVRPSRRVRHDHLRGESVG